VGFVAALVGAVVLAASPVSFVQAHRTGDGGYAEPGGSTDPALTSWAVLGLRAAGAEAPGALGYLQAHESSFAGTTDVALAALAERALGARPDDLLARLRSDAKPTGAIGPTLNSTYWAMLALGAASRQTVRFVLAHQQRSGGFGWSAAGGTDSNDTAAALEALAVAHVGGAPVRRAVRYVLARQNRDGGFELTPGRGSDAQSTAWAIQGLLAARRTPPRSAFRYLARLRRSDGSFRYSSRYVTTPVWVTSQVLAALARKPFPLE
jgi:hypothetical protein